MQSKDIQAHQDRSSDGEIRIDLIEESNTDTIVMDQQEPLADVDDSKLATVTGGKKVFADSEFGKTGIAGIAGIAAGVSAYAADHAIHKKKSSSKTTS